MAEIRVLPDEVRNRIAAGEVVERPANAVKELLENALDAGAEHLEIEIAEGGQRLIRVSDDGEGIAPEDLPTAVLRHATSKIRDVGDIFRITSLGFRGEALPAIAAVSKLEIVSRRPQDESALCLLTRHGTAGEARPEARAPGTQVTVRELFHNTPARRKFLKSPAAEASAIREAVTRLALARPETAFRFINNGATVFDLPDGQDLLERIVALLGADLAESLTEVRLETPELRIGGYVARPPESRPTSRAIYTFVNRRWIQHNSLTQVIRRACEGILPPRRYPVAVLFLACDPERIDVNAHPTKNDIRFRDERPLLGLVHRAVGAAMRGGGAAPADGEIVDPFDGAPTRSAEASTPGRDRPPAERPSATPDSVSVREPAATYPPTPAGAATRPGRTARTPPARKDAPVGGAWAGGHGMLGRAAPRTSGDGENAGRLDLAGSARPVHRVIGQAHDRVLLVESPDGILCIDQHALHERILYEQFRRQQERPECQRLAVPQVVELANTEYETFCEVRGELSELGFELEEFSDRALTIQAVPSMLRGVRAESVLRDTLADLATGGVHATNLREPLLQRMACHAAIKAGDRLADDEIVHLLDRLHREDLPLTCPHGRSFAVRLTLAELEQRFERR